MFPNMYHFPELEEYEEIQVPQFLVEKSLGVGDCLRLISQIGTQLLNLKRKGIGIYGFEMSDILIDEIRNGFCNGFRLDLANIKWKCCVEGGTAPQKLCFYEPFKVPRYCDIIETFELPYSVDFGAVWVALARLVYGALAYNLDGDDSVEGVKLRRCLEYCLEKRELVLV